MKPTNILKKTLIIHKKLSLARAPYQVFFYDFLVPRVFDEKKSIKSNKYFFKFAFGNFFVKFPMKLNFYSDLMSLKKSNILNFYNKIFIKNFEIIFFLSFNLFLYFCPNRVLKIFFRLFGIIKVFKFFSIHFS